MKYLTPHTEEWFGALGSIDSEMATATTEILKLSGTLDVCGGCGAFPAQDYWAAHTKFAPDIGASWRLCEQCRTTFKAMHSELLTPAA